MAGRIREIDSRFFTPRDYQLELLDRAVNHNAVITLGTGAGKTFIAVLLMKEFAFELLENGKKAVFVVDKVALVEQQAEHIECHTSLAVGRLSSNTNNSWWNRKEEFDKFLQQHNVLVITAQILLDLLNHSYFSPASTALLILDECHHSLGARHPYRLILDYYRSRAQDHAIRIVGLTATVINKRVQLSKLEMTIGKLEAIMASTMEPISDLTLALKYGAKPTQILVICEDRDCSEDAEHPICKILDHLMDFIHQNEEFNELMEIDPRPPIREAIKRAKNVLNQVGVWCAWKVCSGWQKRMVKFQEEPHLGEKQKRVLRLAETSFKLCATILSKEATSVKSFEALQPLITPRVRKLLELLKSYSGSGKSPSTGKDTHLSTLIFVDQRCIAYMLNILLRALAKWESREWGFLRVDFVVGHSRTYVDTDDALAMHKRQEQILNKFRSGAYNTLVTTNVLEEGIDVKQCNLVIRFDPPQDFRSFIQSRGRARRDGAIYALLVDERNYNRVENELRSYAQIEEFLMRRLDGSFSGGEVAVPPEEMSPDTLFKPYIVEATEAQVTMCTAIALVNRYCSKLPSDVFTRLVPQSRAFPVQLGDGTQAYQAELELPINSPLKEAVKLSEHELMPNRTLALMAVALKACARLHQQKELNDHLLPMGKDTVANSLSEIVDDEDLPYVPIKAVCSAKHKRLYDRKMSKALMSTLPRADAEPCFIYVIEMRLAKSIGEEGNPKKRKILDPSEVDTCFGFLTSKKLPPIPGFQVFQRQGVVEVNIRQVASLLQPDEKLLNLICLFHRHIFDDILKLGRGGVEFAPEHAPAPILIVPLRKMADITGDYTLDYRYLSEDIRKPPFRPDDAVRQLFKFRETDFHDTVVCPWYRCSDQLAYYYVAEICRDQTPASKFPDEKFESFNEYFLTKYQLEIYDQSQNLLDVDHTSARMNLLLPRLGHAKNAKRYMDLSQRQVLVPELVYIHPLSAPLWSMLIALPTILYRINAFLLVNELRATVLTEALGRSEDVPDDFQWGVLTYPVQGDEECQRQIKNIEQLKRITSVENKTRAAQPPTSTSSPREANNAETEEDAPAECSFEIGVWDPMLDGVPSSSLVESNLPPQKKEVHGRKRPNLDEISEKIGMGGIHSSLHSYTAMSDDEGEGENEDYDIFLDLKYTMHERLSHLSQSALQNGTAFGESGWEGDPASDQPLHGENGACPLSIAGDTAGINLAALMQDLEQGFAGNWPVYAGGKEPVNQRERPLNTTTNGPSPFAHARPKRIYLDDNSDDADQLPMRRDQDAIDLVEFDHDNDNGMVAAPEREGRAQSYTNYIPNCPPEHSRMVVTKQYTVLAPPLKDLHFSFEKDVPNPYGVSPTLLLQALTTASAADGINLERLETVGDSFLKLAVTNYLYHKHPDQHEGKLSFARSKEVSNSRLFQIGLKRQIPYLMEASKFDPHVNWLPPAYASTSEFHALNPADLETEDEQKQTRTADSGWGDVDGDGKAYKLENGVETITLSQSAKPANDESDLPPLPYNMMTQQYISDKAIADAVEALIGAHLLSLGPHATLKFVFEQWDYSISLNRFMHWLGIKVLTESVDVVPNNAELPSLMLKNLYVLYKQFDLPEVERSIGYIFANKTFLVQAFTHASYYKNRVTGCYQRLEFLGDAVLDYLITRYLFEHKMQYSPGILTDLRSALVNNTIFASMAVKLGFQKHFISLCPGLHHMIEKFVNLCKARGDDFHCTNFDDEMFMVTEDEIDEGHEEDIEVPKAMGDIFESVAGAVYLDCGMDLDVVWRVFYNIMKNSIEECCRNPPQSPIRELFERKNCRARFTKLERILETGKVRVTVDVNDMRFVGMGRSYRIAKCTAAKRALKHLRAMETK